MKEVRELVLQLQDQVKAQQDEIDTQRTALEAAGVEDERGAKSRLSSFLETTDFSGWVAASYFYDFNDPNKGTGGSDPFGNNNVDASPYSNTYHQDPNGFQFDEAWFAMDRPATEESPAGYHFEAVFGATASAAGTNAGFPPGGPNGGGNDVWIPAANVSYMTPYGPTLTAGKFGTTIGYEVAGAARNVNITRGFTWNLFQPVSQIGATMSQDLEGGFTYTFGAVNGFTEEQPDTNRGKGFLWQLGWGNDQATMLFNGYYTPNNEGPASDFYLLDVVGELTPTDNLLLWGNLDYFKATVNPGGNPEGVGLSIGSRVGLTEKMGIGGRFEYGRFWANNQAAALKGNLYSLTATTDYALTDNLTWKVEGKWEKGTDGTGNVYAKGANGTKSQAVYLGTQLYYEF